MQIRPLVFLLLIMASAQAATIDILKGIAPKASIYPTVYGLNNQYLPQYSFQWSGKSESLKAQLEKSLEDKYDVHLQRLPKGEVISLLPNKETLCKEYKKCNLGFVALIQERVNHTKLISFVKAFDKSWASVQDSSQLKKLLETSHSKNLNVFNTQLQQVSKTDFIMEGFMNTSITGASSLAFNEVMQKLDANLQKKSKRLGSIEKQSWEEGETLSALYQTKTGSVFVLVQKAAIGSTVQIQKTHKLDQKQFSELVKKKNIIF